MRGPLKLSFTALTIVGMTLGRPAPVGGQTPRPADLVGAWHWVYVYRIDWDSVTQALSPHWREWILTLRADSTYTAQEFFDGRRREASDNEWKLLLGAKAGRWSLVGDTLVTGALVGTHRFTVARTGDTLAMQQIVRAPARGWASEWVWTDTTQPPLATLPPPTLTRTQLVGTWVATTETNPGTRWAETVTDTVILRADSTWAASPYPLPGDGGPSPAAGKWYLEAANTIVLADTARQIQFGRLGRWRGKGAVKLQGQQLLIQDSEKLLYTRVGKTTP